MQILDKMGLSARLLAAVTAGFLALFAALSFLGLQALEQGSRLLLHERQSNARLVAYEIDQFITRAFYELEKATTFAPFDPTAPEFSAEQHMMAHAYGRLGSFSLGVSFLDSTGHIILTEPFRAESRGVDLSNREHIRNALATGQRSISAPHLDLREQRPAVALAVPVKDKTGRVIAVLAGLIDIQGSPLNGILQNSVLPGTTMHAEIFTADGTVVAASEADHLLKKAEHLPFYLRAFTKGMSVIETAPYEEEGHTGETHMMAFVPLSSAPWGLGLGSTTAETFAPLNAFQDMLLFTGLLCLLAVLSLTLAGAQIMVNPVLALTRSARRMAEGDLSEPVDIVRGAEIGQLGASLESMRQRLEASIGEIRQLNSVLEERVRARTAELEERNQELTTAATIAAMVGKTLDLEEVLRGGIEGVLSVIKADGGAIWLSHPPSGDLRLRVHRNLPQSFLAQEQELACGECLCGMVLASGRPLTIRDLPDHPLATRPACRHAGFNSLLVAPLASKGEVRGVFMLGAMSGNFDEADVRLVTAIASQLSVAVENARLYEEIQKQEAHLRHLLERVIDVQEQERKRIARELHDETGQSLIALIMALESTVEALPSDQEMLRARVQWVEDLLRTSLEDIRKIILDLRPSALDDLGLVAALRRYCEGHLGPLGVAYEIRAADFRESQWPDTNIVLFRIAQESINNVARHSEANSVHIEVRRKGDRIEMTIEDDGKGFAWREVEESEDPMRGLGLMGMRERAALFGGTCDIVSEPGQGTRVRVSVPLLEKETVPR